MTKTNAAFYEILRFSLFHFFCSILQIYQIEMVMIQISVERDQGLSWDR